MIRMQWGGWIKLCGFQRNDRLLPDKRMREDILDWFLRVVFWTDKTKIHDKKVEKSEINTYKKSTYSKNRILALQQKY